MEVNIDSISIEPIQDFNILIRQIEDTGASIQFILGVSCFSQISKGDRFCLREIFFQRCKDFRTFYNDEPIAFVGSFNNVFASSRVTMLVL